MIWILMVFACTPARCHRLPDSIMPSFAVCDAAAKQLRTGEVGGSYVSAFCAQREVTR